jgi:hypothetical protein
VQWVFHILSQRCYLIPGQHEEDEDEDKEEGLDGFVGVWFPMGTHVGWGMDLQVLFVETISF